MSTQAKTTIPPVRDNIAYLSDYILPFIAFFLLALSPQMIGVSPDSVVYVGTARSLLNGNGLAYFNWNTMQLSPLTHYPPLYPILLAITNLGSSDPLMSAKWLHAFIFAINVFLFIKILRRCCKNHWLPVVGGVLLVTSMIFLNIHAMAWTEPFFFTCMLAGFLIFESVQSKSQKWGLIGFGIAFGGAIMTRYIGISIAAAAGLSLLLWYPGKIDQRIKAVIWFSIPIIFMLLYWLGRSFWLGESATNRTLAIHLVRRSHIQSIISAFSSMMLPGIRTTFGAGLLLIFIWGLSIFVVLQYIKPVPSILKFSGITAVCYLLFLLFSISFIDALTPLDDRILSPLFLIIFLWVFAAAEQLLPKLQSIPVVRLLPQSILLIYIILSFVGSGRFIISFYKTGLGYTSQAWQTSPLINQITQLPADSLIYSNAPDVIYLITERVTHRVPNRIFPTSQLENTFYELELENMQIAIKDNSGFYINFGGIHRTYLAQPDAIFSLIPFEPVFEAAEGGIYK